jgi:hypothetical protein
MEDSIHERGKSLEDAFFRQRDEELLQRLRGDLERADASRVLGELTGITAPGVIERLASQRISAETLVCLTMVPLVAIAWADGVVQDSEREAILKAAGQNGIATDSSAARLLEAWLKSKPPADLYEAWRSYVGALRSTIDPSAFSQMKNTVISRAESVARTAGGFLGMAAISASEQKILDDLARAFQ